MEQIYDRLAEVFGSSNPNQLFTMLMPGTVLNSDDFSYDLAGFKPDIVREAEGRLVDQMFDLSKISAGSNGRRVSTQFQEALRVLVPDGNPVMPEVKNALRAFLNQPVAEGAMLDGKPFAGSLSTYYFELYQRYIDQRTRWEQEILDKKTELAAKGDDPREAFVEWYESLAEGRLAGIEAARARVTAVCSPADMDAILAALEAGPSGGTEIEEAMAALRNARMPNSDGGYFYPVEFTPSDWFLYLNSDANPDDMLQDPQFLTAALKTKREALQASLSQLQSLFSSMPTDDALAAAAKRFSDAQAAHDEAQQGLMNTGSDAVALGAELYLKSEYPFSTAFEQSMAANQDKVVDASVAEKVKSNSYAVAEAMSGEIADELEGRPFGVDDVKAVIEQQKKAIKAQFDLERSAQELAEASRNSVALQAARFSGVKSMIARVTQQLQDLREAQDEVGRAALAAEKRTPIALGPVPTEQTAADKATAKAQLLKALDAAKSSAATGATVKDTFTSSLTDAMKSAFQSYVSDNNTASNDATVQSMVNRLKALSKSKVDAQSETLALALAAFKDAGEALVADAQLDAAIEKAKAAIAGKRGAQAIQHVLDSKTAISSKRMLDLIKDFVASLPDKSTSKKSDVSPRFMELQFSFSASETESSEVSDSYSTQWRHSGCAFFGSGSGTHSTSSATKASQALDSNTEIRIAFKAAKVEVSRPWLDPGVLALTQGMSKTTGATISHGSFPMKDGVIDWAAVNAPSGGLNDAIFPALPTAFLIVKDVEITFKATASSTSAVHSLVESRSAAGGGFFCFSSSASASSSHESQSMKSRTEAQNVHIRMAAPQILGWFLSLTPRDQARRLSTTQVSSTVAQDTISITDYVRQLKLFPQA
ncbi:hypothetical protein GTZ99_02660 [Novosphingobium sp. FSY-8]|uniref:Uncharacterized protein n=1 Tax=Novosphingobium ovatum TaxID=1908523 RepID=A0ABW9XAA7_9SPHN|nr:hypothetical protein [Novosphingobium ovatum]NBC35454.1 hypothetical protein [Novosphingobium ovatum]